MSGELEYLIFDSSFSYVDRFTGPSAAVALGWSNPGVTQVTLPDDHRVIGNLSDGCRLQVRYRGNVVTEGQVQAKTGTGQATVDPKSGAVRSTGTVTLSMLDDADLVNSILGWPKPSAALGSQTDEFARYIGPIETVLKGVMAENVARLGLPWSMVPTTGLGTSVTLDFRFDKIGDKVLAQLLADGLGLVIERSGSSVTVDVKQGTVFSRPLTLDSGVIGKWTWTEQRPTATRMIGGGASSGTSRAFASAVDSTLEAAWGIREGFADESSADTPTILASATANDLSLAGPSAGLEVELVSSPLTQWFQFDPTGANGFNLGDRVQVQLPAASFDSVIQTVTITDSPTDGVVVKPTVGEFYSPRARMYKSVQRLIRGIRTLERR